MGDHGQGACVVSEATVALPEQRALAAGVTRLHELLIARRHTDIFDFPRRPDGSCQLLAASFIRRLLSGELELKGCVEADVSAAQPDLKLLSTEQLLAIRVRTLTFSTDSDTHRAHSSFITTADALLLEALGRQFLCECQGPSCETLPTGEPPASAGPTAPSRGSGGGGCNAAAELLRSLGLRVVQVVGVVEAFKSGWCSSVVCRGEEARGGAAELPACWAFELAPGLWPDAQAVVINAKELWAAPTAGRPEDFVALAAGAEVVAPLDRSTGVGKDRQLRWEICVLDPQRHDVLAKLRGSHCAGDLAKAQLHLAGELLETLERRNEACPDKSWLPAPRTARDEGFPDSVPVSEMSPRCRDTYLAYHGGKYTGVLGPDGTKCRYRKHGDTVSPGSSADTTAPADERGQPEHFFIGQPEHFFIGGGEDGRRVDIGKTTISSGEIGKAGCTADRTGSADIVLMYDALDRPVAGSAPASPDRVSPRKQLPREEAAEAPAPAATAQDWSLWSYFNFGAASSAQEPAPAVRPAGPPRLRVRDRKAGRGLCGIDPDDMCGEVEVVAVERDRDRSLYEIQQAYPVPATPGSGEPGGQTGGAAALLGRAFV